MPPRKFPEYRLTLRRESTLTVADAPAVCRDYDHAAKVCVAWYRERRPAFESVILLGLDGRNRVIGIVEISRGGAHGCALTPADVLTTALVMGSRAIVLAHNHPSEDPTPSAEDIAMTDAIKRACDVVGLPLLDHIVVTLEHGTRSVEAL
jgi:DNA repair protein RadC